MKEYIYLLRDEGIFLYKLIDGKHTFEATFNDREEMLLYLEKKGYCKLYIMENENVS